jgi:hypothetical protein
MRAPALHMPPLASSHALVPDKRGGYNTYQFVEN